MCAFILGYFIIEKFYNYTKFLIIRDENKRNRQQILEISHFFGFLQQELNSLGPSQELDLTDIDLDDVTLED